MYWHPRKYKTNESFFETIDTEEKTYWLGFITADGWIAKNTVGIHLASVDYEHLEKFKSSIDSNHPIVSKISDSFGKEVSSATLQIHSRKLVQDLKSLGIVNNKTFTVEPCTKVPNSLERHYWRGLVDGDGSVVIRSDGRFRCLLRGNEHIVNGFCNFVKIYIQTAVNPKTEGSIFRVEYGGERIVTKLMNILYGDVNVFLNRKMEKAKIIMDRGQWKVAKSNQRLPPNGNDVR